MTSLHFNIKSNIDIDKHRLLEIFFKDWVDTNCENQVKYKIEKDWEPNMVRYKETFRVDFEKHEDAVALILKGVPKEFSNYIELQ